MRVFALPLICTLSVGVAGCQSSAEKAAIAQREALVASQKQQIASAMASKKIKFSVGVRAMNDLDRADNPNPSSAARESTLYQEALSEKVDTGQISVKEYLYLTEKQSNEAFGKAKSDLRQERMALAAEQVADSQPSFSDVYAYRLMYGR